MYPLHKLDPLWIKSPFESFGCRVTLPPKRVLRCHIFGLHRGAGCINLICPNPRYRRICRRGSARERSPFLPSLFILSLSQHPQEPCHSTLCSLDFHPPWSWQFVLVCVVCRRYSKGNVVVGVGRERSRQFSGFAVWCHFSPETFYETSLSNKVFVFCVCNEMMNLEPLGIAYVLPRPYFLGFHAYWWELNCVKSRCCGSFVIPILRRPIKNRKCVSHYVTYRQSTALSLPLTLSLPLGLSCVTPFHIILCCLLLYSFPHHHLNSREFLRHPRSAPERQIKQLESSNNAFQSILYPLVMLLLAPISLLY